jgi:hypothetical protein
VKSNRRTGRVKVSADGTGLVSRAGARLALADSQQRYDQVITRSLTHTLSARPAVVGQLIDGLDGHEDRLWPTEQWPAMCLDRPLGVGARGGHGQVRYCVEAYTRGEAIRFRFQAPTGFDGLPRVRRDPAAGRRRAVAPLCRHADGRTGPVELAVALPAVARRAHRRQPRQGQPQPGPDRAGTPTVERTRAAAAHRRPSRPAEVRRPFGPSD